MKRAATLFLALGLTALLTVPARGYWIAHANFALDPAVSPEQFRPAADGSRPGPGHPPPPLEVRLMSLPPSMPDGSEAAVERGVVRWGRIEGSAVEISFVAPDGRRQDDGSWMDRRFDADGLDTIDFVSADWPEVWGPNTIGITVPKLDGEGRILEADIFFNAVDYEWAVFPREGVYPKLAALNYVDVEALTTHEMGHMLGLGHSQYPWASMYTYVGLADTRARRLTGDDREGVRNLYPLSESDRGAPSIWGVQADSFGDAVCGMSGAASTLSQAQFIYIGLSGGSLELASPPLAGDTAYGYCLFGSGFSAAGLTGMGINHDGAPVQESLSPAYVAPNFVKAVIGNGAFPTSTLPAGTYDLCAATGGSEGCLPQGLFVNPPGNGRPEAVAAAKPLAEPWSCIRLEGTASYDPESSPLSFRWSTVDAPLGGQAKWYGTTTSLPRLCLAGPGIYVLQLQVSDSTVDSTADRVVVRALQGSGVEDGQGSAVSCSIGAGGRGSVRASLLGLASPLMALVAAFAMKAVGARQRLRVSLRLQKGTGSPRI